MKKIISGLILVLVLSLTVTVFATSRKDEPCRSCNGRGWYKCTMCNGHGQRRCSFCGGEGYIFYRDGSKETCENCRGKGWFPCGSCDEGKVECYACYGTGVQRYVGQ